MGGLKNLVNLRFGKLTVLERLDNNKNGGSRWLCKCDCGNERIVFSGNLLSGHTQSCGCYQKIQAKVAKTVHGMSKKHPLYRVWDGMKDRCKNPNHKFFKDYGGRGITICNEWLRDFKAFYDWSINNGYKKGLEIDRINNNEGYSPDNCRYVTHKINSNNRRKRKMKGEN